MDTYPPLDLHSSGDPNSEEEAESGNFVPFSDRKCFEIVNKYLHAGEKTNIKKSTLQILYMMPDREQYYYRRCGVPFLLVDTICDVAQQIPYDRPFQEKLLALAVMLFRDPFLHSVEESMGISLHEYCDDCEEPVIANIDPYVSHVNFNAFKARLYVAQMWTSPSSGPVFLREVLELEPSPDFNEESARVSAAAMWLIYAVQELFKHTVQAHGKYGLAPGSYYKK